LIFDGKIPTLAMQELNSLLHQQDKLGGYQICPLTELLEAFEEVFFWHW